MKKRESTGVIRRKSATDSDFIRPPNPTKPATDSYDTRPFFWSLRMFKILIEAALDNLKKTGHAFFQKEEERFMARKRLSMRKIKQILRQKWQLKLSNRAIARSIKASRDTVSEYLKRAETAGLTSWQEIQEMNESELERLLFSSSSPKASHLFSKRIPDWPDVRKELSRKGVTLSLLWQEYAEQAPSTAYSYSQFCNLYKRWSKKLPSVMTQIYKGGELLLVDYSGQTVPYVNRITGEEKHAQIFVSALGASNYNY